jgi:hypothetical protein
MKVTLMLLVGLVMMTGSLASAANFGEGYANRVRESRENPISSDDYVYLNSPADYDGPGRISYCKKATTYQGGPKSGMMRTYFVCKVVGAN